MTSMFAAVDHEFESLSGQAKDYELGICCSCNKEATLRRKIKDRLARNQEQHVWVFFSSEQTLLKSN